MKKYILSMLQLAVVCSIVLYSCGDKKETPNPTIESSPKTGTFTDTRDGKVYKTVTISGQTWMAENLNYGGSISTGASSCPYKNDDSCKKYGKIYNFESALIVCPNGTHLPSDSDWRLLEYNIGMSVKDTALIDKKNIEEFKRGYDKAIGIKLAINGGLGFDAIMSDESGNSTGFWTSTKTNNDGAGIARMLVKNDSSVYRYPAYLGGFYCIRCVVNK